MEVKLTGTIDSYAIKHGGKKLTIAVEALGQLNALEQMIEVEGEVEVVIKSTQSTLDEE